MCKVSQLYRCLACLINEHLHPFIENRLSSNCVCLVQGQTWCMMTVTRQKVLSCFLKGFCLVCLNEVRPEEFMLPSTSCEPWQKSSFCLFGSGKIESLTVLVVSNLRVCMADANTQPSESKCDEMTGLTQWYILWYDASFSKTERRPVKDYTDYDFKIKKKKVIRMMIRS